MVWGNVSGFIRRAVWPFRQKSLGPYASLPVLILLLLWVGCLLVIPTVHFLNAQE